MNLIYFLLLPLLTAVLVLLARSASQVKMAALLGSIAQLVLAVLLLIAYRNEVSTGNNAQMLFEQYYNWFPAWNIGFHLGVDGISIAMILLTAFVVIGG